MIDEEEETHDSKRKELLRITKNIKRILSMMPIRTHGNKYIIDGVVTDVSQDEHYFEIQEQYKKLKKLICNFKLKTPEYSNIHISPPKRVDQKYLSIRFQHFALYDMPITEEDGTLLCGSIQPPSHFEPPFGHIVISDFQCEKCLCMVGFKQNDDCFVVYSLKDKYGLTVPRHTFTYFPLTYPSAFSEHCEYEVDSEVYYLENFEDMDMATVHIGVVVTTPSQQKSEDLMTSYTLKTKEGNEVNIEARYVTSLNSPHQYSSEAVQFCNENTEKVQLDAVSNRRGRYRSGIDDFDMTGTPKRKKTKKKHKKYEKSDYDESEYDNDEEPLPDLGN